MQRPDPAQLRAVSDAEEQLWRQRVGALQAAPDLIRSPGGDPKQGPVSAAGLQRIGLRPPDNTVPMPPRPLLSPGSAVHRLRALRGLLVGQTWRLQSLGLLGS